MKFDLMFVMKVKQVDRESQKMPRNVTINVSYPINETVPIRGDVCFLLPGFRMSMIALND